MAKNLLRLKLHKRFVNQILQIGAVKLDENFNIIDIFDVTIKSEISNRVSRRFIELTGITKEMMLGGISLSDAVDSYNKWLGNNIVTITWSNSDLYTIAENEKYIVFVEVKTRAEHGQKASVFYPSVASS